MQTRKLFTAAALAASLFLAAAHSKAQSNPTGTSPADTKDAKQKKEKQQKEGKTMASDDWAQRSASAPRDAASGQSSGKRMHKPITITSENKGTSTSSGNTPQDTATGQASGKGQHEPIVIRKEIDKASTAVNASQATQGQSASNSSKKDDKTKNPDPPKK
jgi:hypothetical protein